MATTAYKRTLLTGGTSDALDSVDGDALNPGDFAFVFVDGVEYIYKYKDYGSTQSESSPDIIVPDLNAGDFGWQLQENGENTRAIYEDVTFYLATTGEDLTGDGSSSSPWYSLEKVFDYLRGKTIYSEVTISIGEGTFTGLGEVLINHPDSNYITISGAGESLTILTFSANGIIVENVHLYTIIDLTIKGASTSANIGLRLNRADASLTKVKLHTWLYCYSITDGSCLFGDGINAYNFTNGLYVSDSQAILISYSATMTFNANSVPESTGLHADDSSAITIEMGPLTLSSGMTYGCIAEKNSFIAGSGIAANFATYPYSPDGTVGVESEPTWGNWGSWISIS